MHRSPALAGALFSLAILLSLPTSSALAAGSRPIPLADTGTFCLASNSSCDDGPWWQAQSDRSSGRTAQFVTYDGLGGLRSEPDFAEAVRLLWQWPEGRKELIGAAQNNVKILEGPRHPSEASDSFATYDNDTGTVEVAYEDMDVPTWMLADLLAHELRHANDLGVQSTQTWDGAAGCFKLEERAYATEQRYMSWLADSYGPLPSATAETNAELSYAADDLYGNMMQIDRAPDVVPLVLHDYADTCTDD
jgi:hypothetical protein